MLKNSLVTAGIWKSSCGKHDAEDLHPRPAAAAPSSCVWTVARPEI